jgi:hypothetical protein
MKTKVVNTKSKYGIMACIFMQGSEQPTTGALFVPGTSETHVDKWVKKAIRELNREQQPNS